MNNRRKPVDPQEEMSPLKSLRLDADLTQVQLAKLIPDKTGQRSLSQRAISGWESGEYEPEMTLHQIAALCRALNISFKALCRKQKVDVTGVPDDVLQSPHAQT